MLELGHWEGMRDVGARGTERGTGCVSPGTGEGYWGLQDARPRTLGGEGVRDAGARGPERPRREEGRQLRSAGEGKESALGSLRRH